MSAQITEKYIQDIKDYYESLKSTKGSSDPRLKSLFEGIIGIQESAMILGVYETSISNHIDHRSLARLNYTAAVLKLKELFSQNKNMMSCDQIFIFTQLVKTIVSDG